MRNKKRHRMRWRFAIGRGRCLDHAFAFQQFEHGLADFGRAAGVGDACTLERLELLFGSSFAARDDGAGVAHAFAFRSGNTSDVTYHRLSHVLLGKFGRFFFGGTTDFTDHHDGVGIRIVLEQFQGVDVAGTRDRVAADTDASGLAQTQGGGLCHGFVGQGAGTGHDTDAARIVDVPRHDADLALTRGDDTRAVRADQADAGFVHGFFHVQHVQGGHAFGDAHDQLHAAVDGFQDGVFGESCRYVDNRSVSLGFAYGVFHGVEYRQAQVLAATFARGDTANHLGAHFQRLLGVESTVLAGETLHQHFRIFVYQYAHFEILMRCR